MGMFGGGGGFYFVPVLTLLFNVQAQVAVSTSLAAIIPTTISASISHYRHGNLNISVGILLGIGGIMGAWLGTYISSLMSPNLLQKVFGVFMLFMGIQMSFSAKKRLRGGQTGFRQISGFTIALALLFGLLSGIMAGLFGLSGSPPVIAGLYVLNLPVNMVIGTSTFVLLFNSISGLIGHLLIGQFDWRLALFLSLGAGTGAFFGPMWLGKIKKGTLERIYGPIFILLVLFLGVLMIFR